MIPFRELLQPYRGQLPPLTCSQLDQLEGHFDLLLRWNEKLNLSAIRREVEIVERHFCESLYLGARLPLGELRLADLGSGGGFPGIPVAVLRPECSMVLIESHQRKAVFLREVSRAMPSVRVVSGRAEEISEKFDSVISRAVDLGDLGEWLREHTSSICVLSGSGPLALSGFEWRVPVALPWGDRRFIQEGINVSRET